MKKVWLGSILVVSLAISLLPATSVAGEDSIVRPPSALHRRLMTNDTPLYDEHYTDGQPGDATNRAPASEDSKMKPDENSPATSKPNPDPAQN